MYNFFDVASRTMSCGGCMKRKNQKLPLVFLLHKVNLRRSHMGILDSNSLSIVMSPKIVGNEFESRDA